MLSVWLLPVSKATMAFQVTTSPTQAAAMLAPCLSLSHIPWNRSTAIGIDAGSCPA